MRYPTARAVLVGLLPQQTEFARIRLRNRAIPVAAQRTNQPPAAHDLLVGPGADQIRPIAEHHMQVLCEARGYVQLRLPACWVVGYGSPDSAVGPVLLHIVPRYDSL